MNHFTANLKAYTALVGSIATALLAIYGPDTTVGHVLTIVTVIATAVGTWAVENRTGYGDSDGDGPAGPVTVKEVDGATIVAAIRKHNRKLGR